MACLRKVLNARSLDYQGPLDRFIGPPVEDWTAALLPEASDKDRDALARDYRNCYDREGWKNCSIFAGLREILEQLHAQGFPLFVCTSKHHDFAVRILDAFRFTDLFTAIYGDKPEYADHSKVALLSTLLHQWSLDKKSTWMIDDRIFDFQAARANHIGTLAAGWGYGTVEELALAGAVAATPAELLALVSRLKPSPSLPDGFSHPARIP